MQAETKRRKEKNVEMARERARVPCSRNDQRRRNRSRNGRAPKRRNGRPIEQISAGQQNRPRASSYSARRRFCASSQSLDTRLPPESQPSVDDGRRTSVLSTLKQTVDPNETTRTYPNFTRSIERRRNSESAHIDRRRNNNEGTMNRPQIRKEGHRIPEHLSRTRRFEFTANATHRIKTNVQNR